MHNDIKAFIKKNIVNSNFYLEYYKNYIHLESSLDDDFDFCNLPLLDKKIVQTAGDLLLSNVYKRYPQNQNLIIKKTSGTTGECLEIKWDRRDFIKSMLTICLQRQKYYNISPADKYVTFHTTIYRGNSFIEPPRIMISQNKLNLSLSKLNLNDNILLEYYMKINEFSPKWMMIQPSIAMLFIDFLDRHDLSTPSCFEYIEFIGEYLSMSLREEIIKRFNVKVANFYGTAEMNGVAYECPFGNMHILERNVFVEILEKKIDDDIERGNIVLSTLSNSAMPLFRYKIGDIGRLIEGEDCPCGNLATILDIEEGRSTEFLYFKDGKKINSYVILYPIEKINAEMGNPIKQYNLTQLDYSSIRFEIVLWKNYQSWEISIKERLIEEIDKIDLSMFNIEFSFVTEIVNRDRKLKQNRFTSKVQKGDLS